MKYKLLKDLPLAKAGTEVTTSDSFYYMKQELDIHLPDNSWRPHCIAQIKINDVPEWLEEVNEKKTIFDLKKWDNWYVIEANGNIWKYIVQVDSFFNEDDKFICFTTEREAKRNKLLRELATRTDKFFPKKQENYIAIGFQWEASNSNWTWCPFEYADYHNWLVFRNVEEYNKYMTEEAKDLLFKI